jgi:N-formylmaleamate deformylase
MSNFTPNDITANGINIHYHRSTPPGGGPPVLMIHGLTDNGMCWIRVANELSSSYDLILPDLRGHGLSDKPSSGYRLEDFAADIAGLIDALTLDPPVVFGHSLGGGIATTLAALYPSKVRALVLEDPVLFSETPHETKVENAVNWCAVLREAQSLGYEGLIARIREQQPGWHEDELGPWASGKVQLSEAALREILISTGSGWQENVRQIQCPVLVVTANPEHVIVKPEMFQEAAALNPRLLEANIPNAGHSIHRDQFESYMDKVKAFLAQL